jgi:hypothetical protein
MTGKRRTGREGFTASGANAGFDGEKQAANIEAIGGSGLGNVGPTSRSGRRHLGGAGMPTEGTMAAARAVGREDLVITTSPKNRGFWITEMTSIIRRKI